MADDRPWHLSVPTPPLWRTDPLRDAIILAGDLCMHAGCYRYAVRIVSSEAPQHRQFRGQTHDCCSVHSRGEKNG